MEITYLKFKKVNKLLLLVSFLVTLLFVLNFIFFKNEISNKQFSVKEQLLKIEGEWHDPTAVILGDKEVIIEFNKKGDVVIGKDENGVFSAKITPFGANNYQAIVTLRGVEGDFELHFYEEDNKLVFFSTLTKSSWYLKKV